MVQEGRVQNWFCVGPRDLVGHGLRLSDAAQTELSVLLSCVNMEVERLDGQTSGTVTYELQPSGADIAQIFRRDPAGESAALARLRRRAFELMQIALEDLRRFPPRCDGCEPGTYCVEEYECYSLEKKNCFPQRTCVPTARVGGSCLHHHQCSSGICGGRDEYGGECVADAEAGIVAR